MYNSSKTLSCFDIMAEYNECSDATGCGTGNAALAWDYQVRERGERRERERREREREREREEREREKGERERGERGRGERRER